MFFQKYSSDSKDCEIYFGNEAMSKRDMLRLKYPIEFGIVTNWDDMEKLWHYTFFNGLQIDPKNHPVLLTEASMNPICNREKMTQIMFEVFNVPALYIAPQTVLSLYACGRTTGVVLHVGQGMCHMVPIYEGHSLHFRVAKLPIGGRDLTDYMMTMLSERGYSFTTSAERELVREMKEKLAFISQDFEKDMANTMTDLIQETYQLPDGRIITIDKERFKCPEGLFKPILMGHELPGVHEALYNNIKYCNNDIVSDLYANTVIAGSSAIFPGFQERLQKEMNTLVPDSYQVNVIVPTEMKNSAWFGGSMFAFMSTFKNMWIDKDEYDEFGPSLVRRKCF